MQPKPLCVSIYVKPEVYDWMVRKAGSLTNSQGKRITISSIGEMAILKMMQKEKKK